MTREENYSDDEIEVFHKQKEMLLLEGSDSEDSDTQMSEDDEEAILDLPSSDNNASEDESNTDENLSQQDSGEEEESWGRSKKAFYSADTNVSDLQDEAAEAKKMQKKKLSLLNEEDFTAGKRSISKTLSSGIKNVDISVLNEDEAEQEAKENSSQKPSRKFNDKYTKSSELSGLDSKKIQKILPKISFDLLDPQQQLYLKEFRKNIKELKEKIEPAAKAIKENFDVCKDKGLGFIDIKCQLLIGYCTNLAFYLALRVQSSDSNECLDSHPVIERLLKYKLLLEKIKPMESKLQYQIDKLLNASSSKSKKDALDPKITEMDEEESMLAFKPNLEMLDDVRDHEDDEVGSDEEASMSRMLESGQKTYIAPKLAPMMFNDSKSSKNSSRREKEMSSKSRLLADIEADIEDRPEEDYIDPAYGKNRVGSSLKQREDFEEDNFVRLTLTKKEQRKIEKLQDKPIDELEDLNDFFRESITEDTLASKKNNSISKLFAKTSSSKRKAIASGDTDVKKPLKSSRNEFGNENNTHSSNSDMSEIEDDMDIMPATYDNHGSDNELYEQAKNKSRAKGSKVKSVKITKFDGFENVKTSRPANYQIIKNKGLTPNRPKEVRNPRVRQRQKYDKAQKKLSSFKSVAKKSSGPYSGETSGIKTALSRSVKF